MYIHLENLWLVSLAFRRVHFENFQNHELYEKVVRILLSALYKVNVGNKWLIVLCSRCRQNLKFADFMLLFSWWGTALEMHGNLCCTCSTIISPFLTNNILALWRCRCRLVGSLSTQRF